MVSRSGQEKLILAVVGLGYVGLPLAVAFGRAGVQVIGFDINKKRIEALKNGVDSGDEMTSSEIQAVKIQYTYEPENLKKANFIIVAVPTPANRANQPDLSLVANASRLVGENLTKGTVVVYESTVYPGVTEDICLPIIEATSGLQAGRDWFIGYSPERVNPGDKKHSVENIIKIVSGQNREALKRISKVYSIICKAGLHKAENIKTAEAAKVFENTQRDVNIALVNELALICHRLGIETPDVLRATATKWNALQFRPGLVGGHCIGVDPYYLVQKAEELGLHPQVIIAGRRVNDYMAEFVAEEVVKVLIQAGKTIQKAKILVMGLTFKENIRDLRNSKIKITINKLQELGIKVIGYDPNLTKAEISAEFGISSITKLNAGYDGIIIGVAHRQFEGLGGKIKKLSQSKVVVMDIPGLYRDVLKNNKSIIYQNL